MAGARSQLRMAEDGRSLEQRATADVKRELEALKGEKAKAEAEIQREMVRLLQEREEGRKALVHEERRNREISTRLERAKEEKHDHELSSQKQMTETLEQLHQAQANERRLGQRCATPRAPALFLYCIELFMCAGLRVWRVSCGQR